MNELDQQPIEGQLLTDEELEAKRDQEKQEREKVRLLLDAFGNALVKSRDEATKALIASGVQAKWAADEDTYNGIDAANRDTSSDKPLSHEGGSRTQAKRKTRSTLLLNITRPYVDAAAAKVADMLLPTDEDNFSMTHTPVPEQEALQGDDTPMLDSKTFNPVVKQVENPDGTIVEEPYTVKDNVEDELALAAKAAEKAKKRIRDWHVECGYHDQFRRVIEDGARVGVGILKGPTPVISKAKKVLTDGGQTTVQIVEKIVPASKRIDYRNLFPDPNCGNNIHNGSYVWEYDTITRKDLAALLNDDNYVAENIALCLHEGPSGQKPDNRKNTSASPQSDKDLFDIWYYTGFVTSEELKAANCECEEGEYIPAIVTMVNDHVIKAALNPSDIGEFPYDVFNWVPSSDYWYGEGGVARQVAPAQRLLTAGVRNMIDNAGLSAGPQIIMRKGAVTPADNSNEIYGRKLWYMNVMAEGSNQSVNDVFAVVNIPSVQEPLQNLIQFALKMAEDTTSLPLLLQGQQGKAPDTVGGLTIISNNASTVLRRLARTADGQLIKPHINRYYSWLLVDPEVPDDEKGDFKIEARGSSALVERDLHNQYLAQAVQLATNPIYELSPARTLKEYLSSLRIDVAKLEYTEQEKKAAAEAAQNAPQDPRIISAQATLESTKMRTDADLQKVERNAQLSEQELQFKASEAAADREFRTQELMLMRDIEMLKMSNEQNLSLEKIKAMLTDTAMKEKNKRELFAAEREIKMQQGSGI